MVHLILQWWRRMRFYLGRARFDRELGEEMKFHLELKMEENLRAGMNPMEARAAAQRQFGNQTLLREASRDMWSYRSVETLLQDLRYGVRVLLKHRGFTAASVLTLALGIGANTAIFSVINSVLLRPLPYHEPDRLMMVGRVRFSRPVHSPTRPAIYLDWRARQTVFEDVAAYQDGDTDTNARFFVSGNTVGAETPERIWGARITANLCGLLGVKAALGRTFLPEEDQPGNDQVALISDALWRRRFAADRNILGKTIKISGKTHTIIGVMPAAFKLSYPLASDLWTPLSIGPQERNNRTSIAYRAIGRLKPGVTLAQARQEMGNVGRSLEQEYPQSDKGFGVFVVPWHEELFGSVRMPLLLLSAAVGLVLLIACVNVINLLLARASDRTKEMAVRAALGAARWRLLRQLLTESLLLSLCGGALGLLLAYYGSGLLLQMIPETVPRGSEVAIDRRVFGFTFLLSLIAGVLFGLIPALSASKPDLNEKLKTGARSATPGYRALHLRHVLVVAEIAIALVLLAGGGLMIRSMWRLQQVELGFKPERVLTMQFTWPPYKRLTDDQAADLVQRVVDRIKALPGVIGAASTSSVPLRGADYRGPLVIAGQETITSAQPIIVRERLITSDYFRVMGIPLLKGRYFTDQDSRAAPRVVIISDTLARQHFAGVEPLGRRLIIRKVECEIIGVVGDVRLNGLNKAIEPAHYSPLAQATTDPACLVVRTSGDPLSLASSVQQAVWSEASDQPVEQISTMEKIVEVASAETRFYTLALGVFAFVALMLGSLGIYGVMSYSVAQRKHELGVRMALGARPSDVLRLVVGQGMWLTLGGVTLGLTAAFGLTRLMSGLLYGVSATDPLTFFGIAVLLGIVALVACLIPARRATRLNPVIALRNE
jgi:putative ABC transport system permease protein